MNVFIQTLILETSKFLNNHIEKTKVIRSLIVLLNEWCVLSRIINMKKYDDNDHYLSIV